MGQVRNVRDYELSLRVGFDVVGPVEPGGVVEVPDEMVPVLLEQPDNWGPVDGGPPSRGKSKPVDHGDDDR